MGEPLGIDTVQTLLSTTSDGGVALVRDGIFVEADAEFAKICGYEDPGAVVGSAWDAQYDTADRERLQSVFDRAKTGDVWRGTVVGQPSTGERRPHHLTAGISHDGSIWVVNRQRQIPNQRDSRTESPQRSWSQGPLVRAIGAVTATTSRGGAERTLCEQLTAAAWCSCAWVGESVAGEDGVRLRARSDSIGGYLDGLIKANDRQTVDMPVARAALRTGSVQTARVDDERFGPHRAFAGACDIESAIAVPIGHDGTHYSVICCYTDRHGPLPDRIRDGLATLGTATGTVLKAAARKRLLFADRTVEHRFRLDASTVVLGRLSSRLDCDVSLEGFLLTGDDCWLVYLDVRGAPLEAAKAVVESELPDSRVRCIEQGQDRLEIESRALPVFGAVSAIGGTVTDYVADGAVVELSVTVPRGRRQRPVVSSICDQLPSCSCVATRDVDRPPVDQRPEAGVLDELTEKQYQALETAVLAGYFDWPRASTAEEVAGRMDITSPTFHAHVRKAERQILAALFGL